MEARKLRLKISTVVFAIVVAASMLVPALAAANPLDNLFNSLGGGSAPASGGSAPSGSTKAGSPPNYVPPLHGTNPHGQGTPATVELGSALDNPYTGTVTQPELLIVGRSKGEQNPDGSYHGHVTLASLGGSELLGINTTPGQTASGPFDALQTALLDAICSGSGDAICLTLLAANSATTGSGSSNSFSAATATLGPSAAPIVSASALTSSGNISDNGTCQTADGHSSVADANVGGLSGITAGLSHSNSTSTACNNGTAPTVAQDSSVLELQNQGVQIPAQGCENGTPNTQFTPLNPLLSAVCNADDTSSGQTTSPYGVREALTAFVLALPGGTVLVKATTAAAESHAVAPPGTPPPPCVGANCPGGGTGGNQNNNNNGNGNGNGNGGPGSGSTATNAGAGNGTLAFTGADLPWLAMLGLGLLGAGLMFAAMPGVRRPRLHA